MSRIGKMPIAIPAGVEVQVKDQVVTVKGAKGTLTQEINPDMNVQVEDNTVVVTRATDSQEHRSLHGLTRTLINNMVLGVSQGYKKELEVNGVGYRVSMDGKKLVLNVGFSHPVVMEPAEGVVVETPSANKIVISGADKQAVGQFAAEVRAKRPPEPYKGKGIKYIDEVIIRKEGKAGKK